MVKSFFVKHLSQNDNFVYEIIKNNPQFYGTLEDKDLLGVQFYDILNGEKRIIGFFGYTFWQRQNYKECILCYVFINYDYRGEGIFNKIVAYTKKVMFEYQLITIGATYENELANKIYSKKFKFLFKDDEHGGNWYQLYSRVKNL